MVKNEKIYYDICNNSIQKVRVLNNGRNAGISEFTVAELTMLAQNEVTLDGNAQAQFEKMIDAIEDCDDVQQVYHNVDLGE